MTMNTINLELYDNQDIPFLLAIFDNEMRFRWSKEQLTGELSRVDERERGGVVDR